MSKTPRWEDRFNKHMFRPEPDITVYELAVALSHLNIGVYPALYDTLPPEVQRHFKVET